MSHTRCMSWDHHSGQDTPSRREPALMTAADAFLRFEKWRDAHEALQFASQYTIGDRTLTRTDSEEIRYWMSYWAGQVKRLRAAENGAKGSGYRVADFRGDDV